MAKLIFGMNVSLDGFVDHDRLGPPEAELFDYFVEQTRGRAGAIYGRGLYELMSYWDGDTWDQDDPTDIEALRSFAHAWRAMPKWVVSRTLESVGPNATLIRGDFEAAIGKLKADVDGEIEVGGPKLAASLARHGWIDEYQLFVHPIALGSGSPYFVSPPPPLRLVRSERIGASAIRSIYVPLHTR